MNHRIFLGLVLTLVLAVLPARALAQAAAETAILKGGSAAATAKTGSALSSTLNQGNKKLAERVQRSVSQPAALGKKPQVEVRTAAPTPAPTPAAPGTAPGQGPVIASIQGGDSRCAPADQTAAAPESKTAAAPAPRSGQECAAKAAPQRSQSVITVSFSK
jgi:hypothetical protein